MKHYITTVAALFFVFTNPVFAQNKSGKMIDANATKETKALYRNLQKLAEKNIMFGHQHATEYGHGWWGDSARSDVKSVTGSHPAIIGVDFSGITNGRPENELEKERAHLRKIIADTYDRGGVTTVAWHFNNPVSAGGFYWVDTLSKPAVKYLMPGGEQHGLYKSILKNVADFANSVKGKNGTLAPMVFRPYHELDGGWFWWGKGHCTPEEITSLWRFTVTYLRDSLHVHNFIYAFSPDCTFNNEAQFTERYPGNDYVDMVGFDDYADFGRDGKYDLAAGAKKLKIVNDFAIKNNKLAAFTETGLESIPNPKWWTDVLLKTLKSEPMKLCYVLVWRNDSKSPTHYYAPYPGHTSVPDFLEFYKDDYTLFENDLPKMYKQK